jgi:hypothetical protein
MSREITNAKYKADITDPESQLQYTKRDKGFNVSQLEFPHKGRISVRMKWAGVVSDNIYEPDVDKTPFQIAAFRAWSHWLMDPQGDEIFRYEPKKCYANKVFWNSCGDFCWRPVTTKQAEERLKKIEGWTVDKMLEHASKMHDLPPVYTR